MTVFPFEGDLLMTEAMAVGIVEMERRRPGRTAV